MDEKFVTLRAWVDTDEYNKYVEEYKTPGYPSVLFLGTDGKEIDRVIGFDEKERDGYIQDIKDLTEGKNTLSDILSRKEKNPEDVDINYKLAKKYMSRQENDKALPCFRKVLELDPEDTKGHKSEASYNLVLHEARANKNIEPLKAFIVTNSEEKYLTSSYATLANHYQRARDTEKVIETYDEALQKMPENSTIMFYFASTIISNKIENLYPKALELIQKVKSLDPELEMSTYFVMTQYYQNLDDTEKVVETLEEAIKKFPQSFGLKSFYADVIYRNKIEGKYEQGIELAKVGLDADPRSARSWYTIGQLYFLKGDPEKAVDAVQKAVEINPDSAAYKSTLEKFEKEIQE